MSGGLAASTVVAKPGHSRPAPPASVLAIANPPDGAVYSIDPTLRREFQALPLRAVTATPTTVRWTVDGAPIGTAASDSPVAWPLAVGSHRIEVQDADGRRAAASVVVR
jgi:membrane carboxypeptidase/penicillin-binding protein PbpC